MAVYEENEEDIFEMDPEDVVQIDTDKIRNEAFEYASSLISNLTKIYSDEELMKNQPNLKAHIDTELDSLANLIKMRSANSDLHDMLVRGIGKNPGNDKLYASLMRIQTTTVKLQDKIDEIVLRLKTALKSIQLEFNFNNGPSTEEEETPKEDSSRVMTKGSKDFITLMQEGDENNKKQEQ